MQKYPLVSVVLLLSILLNPVLQMGVYAQGEDIPGDLAEYTVRMPAPPSDAQEAQAGFNERAQAVINYMACSVEHNFFMLTFPEVGQDERRDDENLTAYLLAKIYKYLQMQNGPQPNEAGIFSNPAIDDNHSCSGSISIKLPDEASARIIQIRAEIGRSRDYFNEIGCPLVVGYDEVSKTYHISSSTTPECLRREINDGLMSIIVDGRQAGSSKLPCGTGFGKDAPVEVTDGEYDVIMRNLIRIIYLTRSAHSDLLDHSTDRYIVEELLTLESDKGPAEEGYRIGDCGNTEHSTGSAQERAERNQFAKAVDKVLGGSAATDLQSAVERFFRGFWEWIARSFEEVAPIGLGIAIVATGPLGPFLIPILSQIVGPTIVASLPVIAAVELIPETENHLFMINSTKYLMNQVFYDEFPNPAYDNRQNGLYDWLLTHLQEIVKEDFTEYNARPYQRYTINAILNLYDYADDLEIHKAAELALDYQSAKFAAGSNQGRRSAPFRRRTEYACNFCNDSNAPVEDIFYAGKGADHQVYRFLVLAGQTGLLPFITVPLPFAGEDGGYYVHNGAPYEMIYAATSKYRLPDVILGIAIDKSTPYVQRIHHGHDGGVEVYASSPGFLISAGGVKTSHAYGSGGATFDKTGMGSSLPTVVIPTVGGITRHSFIRFEGLDQQHQEANGLCDGNGSGCGNWCVDTGFACGLNPELPGFYERCLDGEEVEVDGWKFIDSANCLIPGSPPTASHKNEGPYFFAAIYDAECPTGFNVCTGKGHYGLVEIVDAPDDPRDNDFEAFKAFKAGVLAHNQDANQLLIEQNPNTRQSLYGTYVTHDGSRRYEVYYVDHEDDVSKSYISVINGVPQSDYANWPLAEGGVINASNGIVRIRNPKSNEGIVLDFSDVNNPLSVPFNIPRGQP